LAASKGVQQPKTKDINVQSDNAIVMMDRRNICAQYTPHLRERFSATQMFKNPLIIEKNNTVEQIWREAHGNALQQIIIEQQPTLLKLLHERSACIKR
jgi:hypothetical protein